MNKCSKCGTEFEGNFCPKCGNSIYGKKICPKCGAETDSDAAFCTGCGFFFDSMFKKYGKVNPGSQPGYGQNQYGNNGMSDAVRNGPPKEPQSQPLQYRQDYRRDQYYSDAEDGTEDETPEESQSKPLQYRQDYRRDQYYSDTDDGAEDGTSEEPQRMSSEPRQDYRRDQYHNDADDETEDKTEDEPLEESQSMPSGSRPRYDDEEDQSDGSERKKSPVLYGIAHFIPLFMVLFSVLLLVFYALPLAKIPLLGSMGNVYKLQPEFNEQPLSGLRIALFVYAIICIVLSVIAIALYNNVSARYSDHYVRLAKANAFFYFAAIVLSLITMGVIKGQDNDTGILQMGKGPVMILISASALFLISFVGIKISEHLKAGTPDVSKKKHWDKYNYGHHTSSAKRGIRKVAGVVSTVVILAVIAVVLFMMFISVPADKFRADKVGKIEIGDNAGTVTEILGEPDEKDETAWIYFEKSFSKKLKDIEKEEKEIAEKGAEAYSKNDTEAIERLREKELELDKKLKNLRGKYILIDFDGGTVTKVLLDRNYCIDEEFSLFGGKKSKIVKEVRLSKNEIVQGTKKSDISIIYYADFKDGSYVSAEVPHSAIEEIDTDIPGKQGLSWSDEIGKYTVPINIIPPNKSKTGNKASVNEAAAFFGRE